MDNITSIPYRLFIPQFTSSKQKVPLILYCHGLGDPTTAKSVAKTPVWAFQGSADTTQPPAPMRRMIAALVQVGGTPWYTEIAGAGHQIWDGLYHMPSLYAWMFAQHRGRK